MSQLPTRVMPEIPSSIVSIYPVRDIGFNDAISSPKILAN